MIKLLIMENCIFSGRVNSVVRIDEEFRINIDNREETYRFSIDNVKTELMKNNNVRESIGTITTLFPNAHLECVFMALIYNSFIVIDTNNNNFEVLRLNRDYKNILNHYIDIATEIAVRY